MIIKKCKGCLYGFIENINKIYLNLVPDIYKSNQQNRDNNSYHVTIINSQELKNINFDEKNIDIDIINLGLSKIEKDNNEVYFLYIYSNYLNEIRKTFNLEPKNFHITLGFKFNDIHDKEKSINNIFFKEILNEDDVILIKNQEILDYLKNSHYYPKLLIKELKNNFKNNKKNIDLLIENKNYLGYIFRYQISNEISDLKNAIENYDYEIHKKYDSKNIGTFNCITKVNQDIMKDKFAYRRKMYYYCEKEHCIKLHDMPRNFSWVIENKIGGISAIYKDKDILVLQTLGIKKIYYFLDKHEFDHIDKKDIKIQYVYCINTKAPKLEDMICTLENESFDEPILFGCLGGFGRTGTALACYLCYFGLDGHRMNSESAIQYLRSIRPKSIESDVQMDFVKQFSNHMYQNENSESKCKKKIKSSIKFIMLVGLPASGKSTFCDLFMSNEMNVKVINQDIMGRKICEQSLLKFIKESDITILDRVNDTKKDRKDWIENCKLDPKKCLCIYLSTPKFICIQRAKNRDYHPTIKKGGGERIINDIDQRFEIPTKDEGFSEVIKLEDEEDVRNYLKLWHCKKIELENNDTNFIHKFPRTQHIFNIGGATVDDRILSKDDYENFMNNEDVFIAEKVDGAQLGISIDENYKVVVQNRSHYVNSKSHSQFEKLDKWIMDHSQSLYELLDQDTILFGEWLYAKHSIYYSKLPDYFMAFDLYDKKKKLFYNRDILVNKLKDTNIHYVREIYRGKIKDKNQLLKLIEQKSAYTDDRVEGIYLKIFENNYVKSRCKLVRNDFLSGNEHWSKGIIKKNTIQYK